MNIPLVLEHIRPGAQWVLTGDAYVGLDWLDDSPKPTEDELAAAWPAVQSSARWSEIRNKRDNLLAHSDWTQVADAPVDPAPWAAYRQALRDVPQSFADPDAVVWPVAP